MDHSTVVRFLSKTSPSGRTSLVFSCVIQGERGFFELSSYWAVHLGQVFTTVWNKSCTKHGQEEGKVRNECTSLNLVQPSFSTFVWMIKKNIQRFN